MDNFIHYQIFKAHPRVLAFTTTKQSLKGTRTRFTGDEESLYRLNRMELADSLGIDPGQLVFPRQTHSATVCCVDEVPENEIGETDALVTDQPGLCLCVQTADCVPVLLYDPQKNVAAAVHAGWRGTVKKIVQKTLLRMQREFGSEPSNILAAIGPSIGPEIYEVGPEVVAAVRSSIPDADSTLHKNSFRNYNFDLWKANSLLLQEAGVSVQNIEVLGECSYFESEKYYSARREGAETGRMVSGIFMKEE